MDDEKRVGDAERREVADQLRVAFEAGRLELAEFDERVARAYAAKTYRDLDGLLGDLPGTAPVSRSALQRRPPGGPAATARRHRGGKWAEVRSMWVGFGTLTMVLCGIWLITGIAGGGLSYFWPVWPLGFVALGMAIATWTTLMND
ncbi:uncharacterized protein DUF1707 [Stackebrandtia albiflava]|uniref:Uncharacterized protein DUF1707 n=1 Tax=Stackebrandtia albiflava TaxID=406432 RepID=A0A562V3B2_9ACTN|nr:DUF1707 domain-containing protein [Stackebrandtia albiflava]TWJ12380.1 uncharacterized protein DUF1707 [Stackebrandtia albiflava]